MDTQALTAARNALLNLIQGPPCSEWDTTIAACITAIDELAES